MWKNNYFFRILFLGFLFIIISSFNHSIPVLSESKDTQTQSLVFNTDGLYNAEFYDYIFRGHFENIDIKREDMPFLMIFEQYLRAFGRQCPSYLPEDKVEIMEQVCAMEEVSKNIYGDVLSRVCVEYKWVGTGLFARPDLYNAKTEVENIQRSDALRTTMEMILDPNSMGNSVDLMHQAKGLKNDMLQIFKINSCNSPGVRRFEENLKLFALNKPSIRMEAHSKYATMKKSGGPTGSQDFNKLIDDLVTNQSKTWSFNRYTPGSISAVSVMSKDSQGRPKSLKANYSYSGFGSSNQGWVRIDFNNGLPNCIYFFDFPNNCKTPNSSIVASYAQGDYGR
ncbi:hypothetical protein [Arenibacter sp. ARW7G5Y1]|uniref:hypothetical protein n=1 Tax=Arenibacter sp. ARW7G5Y1 TaxID=2135619 RepID=UPI000D76CFA8|nr:hypothetical protein [Arenibacter sp. ARW7G5Y1]PXX26475.1 hypothetical protein C7972_109170 [Arenibacter sp. ARW7G5Y1]